MAAGAHSLEAAQDGTRAPMSIAGIAYELGEEICSYTQLADLQKAVQRYRMAPDADLWGWGTYRRTRRGAAALAISAGRKTLERARLASRDVDAVILCAVSFPRAIADQLDYSSTVLGELGLQGKFSFGMTLNRCATMMCALKVAADMVGAGRYANVAVICSDAVADEAERFERFAIFSDAACSCVVSRGNAGEYGLACSVYASEDAGPPSAVEIGGRLAAQANLLLRDAAGQEPNALCKVFHDNLFTPIVSMREQMAGFSSAQLFLDNIPAIGHCFACDPLINLLDYSARHALPAESRIGLFSGTPGIRSGLIVRSAPGIGAVQ